MFLSCFETCAHNMIVLERVAYRRGERETYMNTIEVVIHRNEGEVVTEEDQELLPEQPPVGRKVRFRGYSEACEVGEASEGREVEGV